MEQKKLSRLIPEVVRRLLVEDHIRKIILFGSSAGGTLGKDSDLDLMVIKNDPSTDKYQEMIKLRRYLRGLGVPIDLLVINETEFNERIKSPSNVYYWANKTGKVIYDGF